MCQRHSQLAEPKCSSKQASFQQEYSSRAIVEKDYIIIFQVRQKFIAKAKFSEGFLINQENEIIELGSFGE